MSFHVGVRVAVLHLAIKKTSLLQGSRSSNNVSAGPRPGSSEAATAGGRIWAVRRLSARSSSSHLPDFSRKANVENELADNMTNSSKATVSILISSDDVQPFFSNFTLLM